MHENHRERMRQRYLKSGSSGFSDHELLEMMLYRSVPRGDTNETAHRLLEHFGSLHRIFEASVDELQQVSGVGESSAIMLDLFAEVMRRYAHEKDNVGQRFDTVSKIAQYFCREYMGVGNERLYMMLLDNSMTVIDCRIMSEGSVNSSSVSVRKIHELSILKKASSVVLVHNHPHGLAIPSSNDLDLTLHISQSLESIDVVLLEHIIIAGDRFCPILMQQSGNYRRSPISKKFESGFYDEFYDVDHKTWIAPPYVEEKKQ